jgi:hypothetical protein
MKALVAHEIATGLPPSARPIEGSATAVPVNVSGIAAAARHTASNANHFGVMSEVFAWEDMSVPDAGGCCFEMRPISSSLYLRLNIREYGLISNHNGKKRANRMQMDSVTWTA